MPFVQSRSYGGIMITEVTEKEYEELYEIIDQEMELLEYPIPFPSRKGPDYATLYLHPSMGCSTARWLEQYLPRLEEMYLGRIIYSGSWKDKENV